MAKITKQLFAHFLLERYIKLKLYSEGQKFSDLPQSVQDTFIEIASDYLESSIDEWPDDIIEKVHELKLI